MWRMAGRTAFGFDWCVLEGKGTLLVRMTLDAGRIGARSEPGLL